MRSGFLVVDKAPGTRSSRCVNIVKKIFSGKLRVGHGGTLDSTASGVLVVLVGKATRVSQYVMMLPKVYSVTAKFGMRSDTDDHSGKILSVCGTGIPDDHAIDRALLSFSGLTDQVPPSISAVKVNGKRAHAIAREGGEVFLEPRPVLVNSISRVTPLTEGHEVVFRILCHRGTYIRSIVRDLGDKFGCGALVVKLQRESIGPFGLKDALPSPKLEDADPVVVEDMIIPLTEIGKAYTTYQAAGNTGEMIFSGKPVPLKELRRTSWGSCFGSGYIMITGEHFVSFAHILNEGKGLFARPVTTIPGRELV